jgi:SAM-dependent methyltransferase
MSHGAQFSSAVIQLREMYDSRLREYGDSPQAAQHTDQENQESRLRPVCEVGDLRIAKVLDFGCGLGHALVFLREHFGFKGEYVGYDISPEMVRTAAAKHPDSRFECRDILTEGLCEDFDYVLISGVFNPLTGDNWEWMTQCLRLLWERTKIGLSFNNLSRYVDFFAEDLYYEDPARVFRFCKEELSPLVTLRHDYCVRLGVVPYEFTTYVYRTEITSRKLNSVAL